MITRRNILKGMAAAPIGGHIVVEQAKMRLLTGGLTGAAISGQPEVATESGYKRFSDFMSWFRGGGEKEMRDEANNIDGFDPDLIEMHSPSLATKVRMQRKRNYERLLKKKKSWVEEQITKNGHVKDWF